MCACMRNKLDVVKVACEWERHAADPSYQAALFCQCRATLTPQRCEIPQKMASASSWLARADAATHGLGEGNEYGEQKFS